MIKYILLIIESEEEEMNNTIYLGGITEGQSWSDISKGLTKARRARTEEVLKLEMPFL